MLSTVFAFLKRKFAWRNNNFVKNDSFSVSWDHRGQGWLCSGFWLNLPAELCSEPALPFAAACSHLGAVSRRLFVQRVNWGSWFGWRATVSVKLFQLLYPSWIRGCIHAGEGQCRYEEQHTKLCTVGSPLCWLCESTAFIEFSSFIPFFP